VSDGAGAVTVVDTNVPVVANGNSEAGSKCVRRCVGALRDLIASGRIAIDDGWRIIDVCYLCKEEVSEIPR
jgi:PP-loop superfamily ATP-utilizing enzyme